MLQRVEHRGLDAVISRKAADDNLFDVMLMKSVQEIRFVP